jgi:aminopeptidase N
LTGLPVGFNDWFMVNPKGRMFYRVHYDDLSRQAIVNQLETNPRAIEGQTKTQFIDDTFTVAKAGLIPATEAMATTTFLADEFTYNPWYPAVKHFQYIQRIIMRESWYSSYRSYVLSLTTPVYSALGWTYYDYETPLEQYLRRDMISLTCSFGGLDCFDASIAQYYLARNDTTKDVVDPNSLPTVLCSGIQTFANNWNMWMTEYTSRKSSQVREERYAYLFGLSCTNLRANLNAYMTALIGDGIATRDKNTAAGYLALNDIGAVLMWDYLDNNWLSTAFSGKFTTLTTITNGFSSQAGLDQLRLFIERHPATSQSEINSYDQMILNVQQNIQWLQNNTDGLADWLSSKTLRDDARDPLLVSSVHHWTNIAAMYERDSSSAELF